MTTPEPDIGGQVEELLRTYFLSSGYFVARGIKVRFADFDVTDIDLWLYSRPSPLVRERINVDAKYKQSPKALERVLWTKGAQAIVGADRCIVATTDKRPAVKQFGAQHGVLVLDGHFLARLRQAATKDGRRLPEEAFLDLFNPKNDRLFVDWRQRIAESRSHLLSRLDFGGCVRWLDDIRYFVTAAVSSNHRVTAYRLTYLSLAHFLIGLDFASRHLGFEEPDVRLAEIEDGLRYGPGGRDILRRNLAMTYDLINHYAPQSRALGASLSRRAMLEIDSLPLRGLAEFFTKSDIAPEIFSIARELEDAAYQVQSLEPGLLGGKAQACIGAMLDFAGLDRTEFYERAVTG